MKPKERVYYVYVMANASGTLYTGMTNDIRRRVMEHKEGSIEGFTKKYKINRLLFYEEFGTAIEAIETEKQIKGWKRQKKIELINRQNPMWEDLSREW